MLILHSSSTHTIYLLALPSVSSVNLRYESSSQDLHPSPLLNSHHFGIDDEDLVTISTPNLVVNLNHAPV